jgi:hypothetical protein
LMSGTQDLMNRAHTIHTPSHIDYIARWLPQTIRN